MKNLKIKRILTIVLIALSLLVGLNYAVTKAAPTVLTEWTNGTTRYFFRNRPPSSWISWNDYITPPDNHPNFFGWSGAPSNFKWRDRYSQDGGQTWSDWNPFLFGPGTPEKTHAEGQNNDYYRQIQVYHGTTRVTTLTSWNAKIDDKNPTITYTPNGGGWDNTSTSVTVRASDDASGFQELRTRVSVDGTWGSWSSWQTASSKTITVSATGRTIIQTQAKDKVGNVGSLNSATWGIDKTAPTGTISGNPTAWRNTDVTLTFTGSDTGGAGVKRVRNAGGSWVNGSSMTRTVSTNGTYSFEVEDNAGNTRTVSANVNRIDKQIPDRKATTVYDARYVSGNDNWYQPGDKFRVKIIGYDDESKVRINYLRLHGDDNDNRARHDWDGKHEDHEVNEFRAGTYTTITGGTSPYYGYTAEYIFDGVIASNAGNRTFVIDNYFTDYAGNVTEYDDTGKRIKTDGTAPTTSNVWIDDITIDSFYVYVDGVADGQSGVKEVRFPAWTQAGGQDDIAPNWRTNSSVLGENRGNGVWRYKVERKNHNDEFGLYNIHPYVFDNVGNQRALNITHDMRDTAKPTLSVSPSTTSWTNSNVVVTLTGSDVHTGLASFTMPNGTVVAKNVGKGVTTTHTYTITTNGTYSFKATDAHGNETIQTVTISNIDKTAPTGTISGNPTAWTNQNATLTLNATDSGGSGVRRVRIAGGTWVNGSTTSQVATENGTYSFEIEDNVGNTQTVSATVNRIDKAAPTGTISGNPTAWTNSNVTLSITTTDTGGSNVRRIQRPDGTWVTATSTTHTVSANGTYDFVVEDHAGNTRTVSTTVNRIDKTDPNGTITGNPTAWTNSNVTLSITTTDTGGSNVRRIQRPDGTWVTATSTTHTVSANGTYDFVVEDHAGNTRTVSATVNRIDKTDPNGTISGNPTAWQNRDVILTLSTADTGGSNVRRIQTPDGSWVTATSLTYTVSSNATYTFVIEDHAGNTRSVSTTVNRIDKTAPGGSVNGNPTTWQNTDAVLTFNGTDSGSGVKRVRVAGGTWVTGSTIVHTVTTNGTYSFEVEDNAGNTSTVSATVNRIDKSAPTGTIVGNPTTWQNTDVTLSISATDTGGSNVKRIQRPDGTWVTGTSTTYTVLENGTYAFVVEDNAGNTRSVTVSVNRIDKVDPNGSITGNPTAWQNTDAVLTLNATDSGGAGVKRVRVTGGTWVTGSTVTQTAAANGTYSFEIEDNAGNTRTVSATVNRIDKAAPAGTITGNSTVWQNADVTLSITTTDTGGSNVRRIQKPDGTWVTGTSTTHTVTTNGTYAFIVEDNAGNTTIVSVTVNRIDKGAPTGTVSGNPTVWQNTNATLTFTGTDTGSGVRRVRIAGGTWVNGSTVTQTASANGTYSFEVEDNAGNTATVSVTVTRIDKTLPTGSLSGNASEWTNQAVTLILTASDTGGSGYYRTKLPDGTFSTSATPNYVVTKNGTYSFTVYDHAGNERTVSQTVTHIDTTKPIGTVTGNPTVWQNTDVILTLTASDAGGSGYHRTKLPDGTFSTSMTPTFTVSANGTYTFTMYDHAGNEQAVSVVVNRIDKTAPSGTVTGNPTTWQNTNATLTLSATDAGGSGYYRTKLPDGSFTTSATPTFSVAVNGIYTFTVYDNAGNSREISVTVNRIDKTAPNGTIAGNPTEWTNQDVILTLSPSDAGGSGYHRTKLPDGTFSTSATPVYTASSNGTYTFTVYDTAGNERNISVTVSRIDKVIPGGSISGNPISWTNQDVILDFNATDSGGSGVRRVRKAGGTWVNGASITKVVSVNGTYSFEVEDNAGNVKVVSTTVNRIDKEKPTLILTGNPTNWVGTDITLAVNASDTGGSGIKSITLPNGQVVTSTQTTFNVSTNQSLTFKVEDNAGNQSVYVITVTKIDKTLPSSTLAPSTTGWTNQNVTLTLQAFDNESGIKEIIKPDGTRVAATPTAFVATKNGTYTFTVVDNVNNTTTKAITVTNIDKEPPSETHMEIVK